ncbi:MAG: hypothetical protein OXT64_17375 [Gammaproteobacteria bacterium]|nr:hypothetical protein [Gammaproteobacteria bacterium]MDE0443347.1 hypothetical protein [Gammaproteobacteria bacterium]
MTCSSQRRAPFPDLQPEQVHDLLPVDLFSARSSRRHRGFPHREAGEPYAPGDGAVAALGGLAFDEPGEQRQVVPLLLGGGDEFAVVFADEGELQGVEVGCPCRVVDG